MKVPVHEVAMMMSIALRFIPILVEETDKIMKAQMARGADFESGNLMQRAKAMVPLWFLCLSAHSAGRRTWLWPWRPRCYRGGEGRTKMKPLHYETGDRAAYTLLAVYLAVMAACRIYL